MNRFARVAGSLEARTVAVMLLAVLVVHAGALLLYRQSAGSAADEVLATRVATQLSLAREAVLRRPRDERAAETRALSSAHFEIDWSDTPGPARREAESPFLWNLRNRILALEPGLAGADLALSLQEPGHGDDFQELRGTLVLPDDSVLTFQSAHSPNLARLGPWALLSTAMAILVGVAAVLLVHRIGVPLRRLTQATARIGHGPSVPVPETGPDETRAIARALNAMQDRVREMVTERTQALAAVSHDLRTPITRLRLRLDGVPDPGHRIAMASDLDDMQSMIDSTLAYLRGEADPEARQITNVASLLLSIVDAASDAGWAVTYDGPSRAPAPVRPVALKRALENLVDNAVRYGARAGVSLAVRPGTVVVTIEDSGPGIPQADLERAFEPFTRLDASRNRNTGGTGLGLTIARRTIEREGGTLGLSNRSAGGLTARVELPGAGERGARE